MELVDTLTLEDGNSYFVTDEININGVRYVCLTNDNDLKKFCIRKINIINGEEYLVGLENKQEFEMVLLEFNKKHHN